VTTKNGRWYATFECERDLSPLSATGRAVGVDRGVRVLVATSDGERITNPRIADRHRATVEQHALALDTATVKDARGRPLNRRDPARIAAVRRLARAKEREASSRRDYLRKVALSSVRRYDIIAIEDLRVRNMTHSAKVTAVSPGTNVAAKSGLNRAILDAGFGILATLIREKAEYAARVVVNVNLAYTSQTCAACVRCGHSADADINAAQNILVRATAQLAPMSALSPASSRFTQHDAT
jgi:putative transposase